MKFPKCEVCGTTITKTRQHLHGKNCRLRMKDNGNLDRQIKQAVGDDTEKSKAKRMKDALSHTVKIREWEL